ncbi:hypothetical protein WA588_002345, partial [Blastocystis sp. NMH]
IGGTDRLRVVNCANLSSIDIGELAFTKYKNLELTNLPLLQRLSIGSSAFQSIQTILMENLPSLQSIQLGDNALQGDSGDKRKMITEEPYNYRNTMTMRNLPSLTSFVGGQYNFQSIGTITLENVIQSTSSGIYFGGNSFQYTNSVESYSNPFY